MNAAGLVASTYQQYAEEDFEMFFVVSQDSFFAPSDVNHCNVVRNSFGLTMPVLMDPQGIITNQIGIPANTKYVVMGEGNEIVFRGPNPQDMHNAIDALLAE